MKSIGGILGAVTFLLLLATVGSVMFPVDDRPNWTTLVGAAVVCGVLSVITFSQSKKSDK